ncbi:hypothetical protein [uncultured Microbacterium sp.]|uniref:hypothetical protein n=1 Tax=uncultured Microbacterium sp. TaxID=191216 RepID=UPI0028DB4EC3|nr:hypothetical protein [uncultured Microbacterium sp.]
MNAFTIAVGLLFVFAGVSGVTILAMRHRILQFVRMRYEEVFREDQLSEAETQARLPRMWLVVFIGVGSLIVAVIAAVAGWTSVTQ